MNKCILPSYTGSETCAGRVVCCHLVGLFVYTPLVERLLMQLSVYASYCEAIFSRGLITQ